MNSTTSGPPTNVPITERMITAATMTAYASTQGCVAHTARYSYQVFTPVRYLSVGPAWHHRADFAVLAQSTNFLTFAHQSTRIRALAYMEEPECSA